MTRPLLLPEPFSGEAAEDWSEWIDHFGSVAVVNKWESTEEKQKWLHVRLTGRAQAVFRKLPEDVRGDFSKCVDALHRRYDPDSKNVRCRAGHNTSCNNGLVKHWLALMARYCW